MKNIIKMAVVIAAVFMLGALNVNAASASDLKDKLLASYSINGTEWSATSSEKVEIERYFTNNNISDEDATYIIGKFDEAIEIVKNSGATSASNLNSATKDKLKALATDISSNTSIKLTVTNEGIQVYNLDGTAFTMVKSSSVRYTSNEAILVIAGTITLIGIGLILRKAKKANA